MFVVVVRSSLSLSLSLFFGSHLGVRGGRGFPTPVFSRQLGLFLLGYRGVFSIFWKRFNMFFLITKPGGNEGKQAKTQTNPAEMPEDRRRWGAGWLGTSTEGPRGSLQTSFKSRNQPDEGLCVSGTPPAAKKRGGWSENPGKTQEWENPDPPFYSAAGSAGTPLFRPNSMNTGSLEANDICP